MQTVLVTGATGNVGKAVVRSLLARGVRVRAADRDVKKIPAWFGETVEAARLDFLDPRTFAPALRGCDGVFLMRPPAISDVKSTLVPFTDAARTAGARQVVFLSVAGAAKNPLVPHHAVETHLMTQGKEWTVLRPGFFAQNLGDAYRLDITVDHRLYVPAGEGRVAFVDARDIAEIAAMALVDPDAHAGEAYTLTGPEAVGFREVAALLTETIGYPVRYEAATLLGYVRHLRARKMPRTQITVQAILHAGLRFGQAATVDPTLPRLLGRPGRTLREYVTDHRATWT